MTSTTKRRDYGIGRDGQPRTSPSAVINQTLGWGTDALMNFAGWAAADRMAELVASGMAPGPAKFEACKAHIEVRETKAESGTIAHAMIEAWLRGQPYEPNPFIPRETVEAAERAAAKFREWWPSAGLEALLLEHQMIDEVNDFGGTIDMLAKDKQGRHWVADIKTGSTIKEHVVIQLGAYASLLQREGVQVAGGLVIHAPVKDEPLTVRVIKAEDLAVGAGIFAVLLQVHRARGAMKKAIRLNRKHFEEIKGAA